VRLLWGLLAVVLGLSFGSRLLMAAPANPKAFEASRRDQLGAVQDAVYGYRRTKHGFERCHHRNRFGTRSWRSVFSRIPDC
jgi:hypothetical protein